MNANDQFFARDAKVDSAAVAPLPASRKIYVEGSRPDLRVPMREISQSETPASVRQREQPADRRLRHVGALHRPRSEHRHPRGLPPLRAPWIARSRRHGGARRADVCLRPRAAWRSAALRHAFRPAPPPAPRQGPGANVIADALRPPRHRHAGDGIHRDPREPEARGDAARRCPRWSRGSIRARASARRSPTSSRRNSCATKWRAAARSSRPTSTTRKPSR